VDGRALGTAEVPPWSEQLATIGQRIIRWRQTEDGSFELSSLDPVTGAVGWRKKYEPASRVDIDMGRYVAVVEPSGRANIVYATDGSNLVDLKIPPAPRVEEIHLVTGQDNFTLIAKHPQPGNAERTVNGLTVVDSPVISGQVFVFDRRSGRMLWNRPADVVQQAFLLTQGADLPFIVFAGAIETPRRTGTRAGTAILVLDKATGRTLYSSDDLPQAVAGQCVARITDAAEHKAAIEMAGRTIELQFTGHRRPPEPPAMADVESSAGKVSRGLTGILRNLMDGNGGD
jgi:outer membrane protein assembly factor BamB